MAILQELNSELIDLAISQSTQRHVPVTVTVQVDNRWVNFHSRAVALQDGHWLIESPRSGDGAVPHEFTPAEKVGVSFKLKHYKHISAVTVVGTRQFRLDDGTEVPVLAVCLSTQMQRLQRRAYERVTVPANRVVRATYWLGGCWAEPTGPSTERPVWYGRIINLSAGGLQMNTGVEALEALEIGDTVGLRVIFGAGEDAFFADAQLRHVDHQGDNVLMGLQLVGLAHTEDGRKALQFISDKVAVYHRVAAHAGRR